MNHSLATLDLKPRPATSLHKLQRDPPLKPKIERVASKSLWLHLHLPYLPLEVLTRGIDTGEACVLSHEQGRRRTVMLANRHAVAMGIKPGMPLGAAHALAQLRVLERSELAEQRALKRLCLWAMQITPMVCEVSPDGLLLEIRGSLKLFGGLDNLLARLRRGLRQLGYCASYAVAPTPLAAGLLARARPRDVVLDRDELLPAVANLPISALRLKASEAAALDSFGVKQVGQCRRLPRDGLARRLSPALLNTLDRLFGRAPDPRTACAVPRSFDAQIELPWEVDNARGLLTAGERLLHELNGYLKANAGQTGCLRWRLIGRDQKTADDNEYFEIKLAQPSCEVSRMLMLLRETLARTTLTVPVRAIGLNVSDISFISKPISRDLFAHRRSVNESEETYASFVDRLRSRCGETALRSLGIKSAHDPEQAWCWRRVKNTPERVVRGLSEVEIRRSQRPVWLLKQPVKLNSREGRPMLDGPLSLIPDRERIVNGWWSKREVARDYFIATSRDGGRLWVFRELTANHDWYLHGIFD